MNQNSIQLFISSSPEQQIQFLTSFISANEKEFGRIFSERQLKSDLVSAFATILQRQSDESDVDFHLRKTIFSSIRILARDTRDLDLLVRESFLNLIISSAFPPPNRTIKEFVVVEALKCIYNLVFHNSEAQHACLINGCVDGIFSHLASFSSIESPFTLFELRILFLLTAHLAEARELLAMPARLTVLLGCLERALSGLSLVRLPPALLVPEIVERVATDEIYVSDREASAAPAAALSPARADLVCEMLKLLFNVTLERARSTRSALKPSAQATTGGTPVHKKDEQLEHLQSRLLCALRTLLHAHHQSVQTVDGLLGHSVNLMLNVPSELCKKLVPLLDEAELLARMRDTDAGVPTGIWEREGVALDDAAMLELFDLKSVAQHRMRENKQKKEEEEAAAEVSQQQQEAQEREVSEAPREKQWAILVRETSSRLDVFTVYARRDMTSVYLLLRLLARRLALSRSGMWLREHVEPLLVLLSAICRVSNTIRRYCRLQVLPPMRTEVLTLPQSGTSLRNRICAMLTGPIMEVSSAAADFLFVLCNENVGRLVKYSGYGNAAGLLARRGLLGGGQMRKTHRRPTKNEEAAAAAATLQSDSLSDESETEEYASLKDQVNPVTGRVESERERERNAVMNAMSEEQKEFEAMRLVNEISRLHVAGIVQPCTIGADGVPTPIRHVLQLQDSLDSRPSPRHASSDRGAAPKENGQKADDEKQEDA